MLPHGAAITVSRAWEFLPYNDMRLAGLAKKSFKAIAGSHAQKLIRSASTEKREAALEKIRKLHDAQFKTPKSKKISASRRNLISLLLSSGPIGAVELQGIAESVLRHRLPAVPMRPPFEWLGDERFGQMFTGDGYLKTVKQLDAYEKFFTPYNRLKRSAFFSSHASWCKSQLAAWNCERTKSKSKYFSLRSIRQKPSSIACSAI